MALVDPYAPCPCGSDKKFKWCCQKVESYAERAQRLVENGQYDAAISVLSEGLAKVPDNPWLLLRKAMIFLMQQKPDEAKQAVASLLRKQPDHLGAAALQTRLLLGTDGPVAAAIQFQRALNHITDEARPGLARLAAIVALGMSRAQLYPAAFKHFQLALDMGPDEADTIRSSLQSLKSNPAISPWLKVTFTLLEAPEGMPEAQLDRFDDALDWADDGLWGAAASAFELLSADPVAGAAADHNLGLCRLWLGEEEAAVKALRRWIPRAGASTAAIDLAVVCQLLEKTTDREPIEVVQLSWQIRDREALLKTLIGDHSVVEAPDRRLEADDKDSPEVFAFHLLDRARVDARPGLRREEVPLVLGEILVGPESVVIEAPDDGRLNGLIDRFTVLAGKSIPPAHPRTKVVGRTSRSELALSWHWYLPPDLPDPERLRLNQEQIAHLMTTVWPETPMESLNGKTPLQAARSGQFQVPLRAAVLQMELSEEEWGEKVDWDAFRSKLGIPAEPAIDPQTVDIDETPLPRLALVPVSDMDDDRLVRIYRRAHEWGLARIVVDAARQIVDRPGVADAKGVSAISLYGDLAHDALIKGDREAALEWNRLGRSAEAPGQRAASAPHWDMQEIQIRSAFDDPEEWVPDLAVLLERYQKNEQAMAVLTTRLVELGLIRVAPVPDRSNEIQLDPRPLQQVLSRYGPKVTTSTGYLGVSATKGEIWTPESASRTSGSAIWTPGSDAGAASGGEKPRIIVPGR
jgi:tetratricopeptide (TPR) repeat protein